MADIPAAQKCALRKAHAARGRIIRACAALASASYGDGVSDEIINGKITFYAPPGLRLAVNGRFVDGSSYEAKPGDLVTVVPDDRESTTKVEHE